MTFLQPPPKNPCAADAAGDRGGDAACACGAHQRLSRSSGVGYPSATGHGGTRDSTGTRGCKEIAEVMRLVPQARVQRIDEQNCGGSPFNKLRRTISKSCHRSNFRKGSVNRLWRSSFQKLTCRILRMRLKLFSSGSRDFQRDSGEGEGSF